MTANSNPNLFRLSLPEWLKEEVESGKHKGVYWIDKKEKIFHVPWKHASRNGWEDGDVSLFKAWAIYTNRYREGIDKPRPALWKTNFRCAINSHNYISFLKDQGQRKGDKAHRIMKLTDPTKSVNVETIRVKRVRVTSSNSSETHPKRVRSTYPKTFHFNKNEQKYDRNESYNSKQVCEAISLSNYSHRLKLEELNTSNFAQKKPNLEDLYFFGKALQSLDDPGIGADIAIKTESNDSLCSNKSELTIDAALILSEINKNMTLEKSDYIHVEKYDDYGRTQSPVNKINGNSDEVGNCSNSDNEDDDDLITPRNPCN